MWNLGLIIILFFSQENLSSIQCLIETLNPTGQSRIHKTEIFYQVFIISGVLTMLGVSHLCSGFSYQGRSIHIDSWNRRNWFHTAGDIPRPNHLGTKKQDYPWIWGTGRERVATGGKSHLIRGIIDVEILVCGSWHQNVKFWLVKNFKLCI
jgi:hypothetical protein